MRLRGISRGLAALGAAALVAALPATVVTSPASADDAKPTAMVLILDASGSMKDGDGHGSTKIATARSAVKTIIGQLPAEAQVGLMVYGNRVPSTPDHAKACGDINLVAPVAPLDKAALTSAVDGIDAKGETPIGASLQRAAAALPKGSAGSIVLVSDGEDSCAPPAPCDVAKQLSSGGVQLTVDTVGLKVSGKARSQLTCISQATGGSYTDVQDAAQLADKLGTVTQNAARARRQVKSGSKVQGGPTIGEAPILADGKYTDTIVVGEKLFFGTEIAPGGKVSGRATVDATKADEGQGTLWVEWDDADGKEVAQEIGFQLSGEVGVKGATITSDASNSGPQKVYFSVIAKDLGPAGTEMPLTVEISGSTGGAASSADASASAGAAPQASDPAVTSSGAAAAPSGAAPRTPATDTTKDTSEGFSLIVLLACTGGAAVAGLLVGLLLGRSRGSRSAGGSGSSPGTPAYPGPYPAAYGQQGPQPMAYGQPAPAHVTPVYPTDPPPPLPPSPPVAGFHPVPYQPASQALRQQSTTLPPPR